MKNKVPNDRSITIYEPLLFGSLAVAAGMIYLIVNFIS